MTLEKHWVILSSICTALQKTHKKLQKKMILNFTIWVRNHGSARRLQLQIFCGLFQYFASQGMSLCSGQLPSLVTTRLATRRTLVVVKPSWFLNFVLFKFTAEKPRLAQTEEFGRISILIMNSTKNGKLLTWRLSHRSSTLARNRMGQSLHVS